MKITLFKPHIIQKQIINAVEDPTVNFISVCCGRRLGKSMCNINLATKYALTHDKAKILYLVPSSDQRDTIFNEYLALFEKAPFINKVDNTKKNIHIGNGSIIKFRIGSMPSANSLKGNAFNFVIIDEATLIPQVVWDEILSPTLATTETSKLKILFTSTPKSKDWFYRMFQKGLDPTNFNYRSIHAPSSSSPFVNPDYLDDMRKSLPANIYKQEILAEFLENSGSLFENISNNISKTKHVLKNGMKYFAGIDTGFVNDSTVVIIIDEMGNIVDHLRFSQMEMKQGAKLVFDILRKWNFPYTLLENNMYQGFYEMLLDLNVRNLELFMTTGKSKTEIIEDLTVIFQNNEIKLIDDEYFISEFFDFGYQYNVKTRTVSYSAPAGLHDDIVMATAIAFKSKKQNKIGFKYDFL